MSTIDDLEGIDAEADKVIAMYTIIQKMLTELDWSKLLLQISAKRGVKMSTLARELNCNAQGLRRLARGDVAEPRVTLAFKIFEMGVETLRPYSEKMH